jgi:hypothetical protein
MTMRYGHFILLFFGKTTFCPADEKIGEAFKLLPEEAYTSPDRVSKQS